MPTKRRTAKHRTLDDHMIEELLHGPGSCLLAGCGYYRGGFFWKLPEDDKPAVIAEMREDWFRHREQVLAAWDSRDEHPWRKQHTDQTRPWAETEFEGPTK